MTNKSTFSIFLYIISAALFYLPAAAYNDEAVKVAEDFYKTACGKSSEANLVEISDNPDCLTFNMAGGGYIIVSISDTGYRVIGYSDRGELSKLSINPVLSELIDNFNSDKMMCKVNKTQSRANTATSGKVDALLGDISWAQWYPFNLLTPEIDGKHCPTGCVATGIAQIMRYYKYPAHGKGQNSYEWNGQTLTADFSKSTYDWNLMHSKYDMLPSGAEPTAEELEVAKLMRDAGYACNMDYGVDMSGGAGQINALISNFGYDKAIRKVYMNDVKFETFKDIIRSEISQGRPVFFSSGAHFYICDGFDENGLFHFNYGWGGDGNGYFEVNAFCPDDSNTSITYGVQPDKNNPAVYTGTSKRNFLWNGSHFSFNYSLFTSDNNLTCQIGLSYRNIASQEIICVPTGIEISGSRFDNSTSLNDIADLPDGNYEISPVFRTTNSTEWEHFYFADKLQETVSLEIKNGERQYTNTAPEGKVYLDNLVYMIDETNHTASLVSYISSDKSYSLNNYVIPSEIEYKNTLYPVTEIGQDALSSHPGKVNLSIGANIQSILEGAFTYVDFEKLNFPGNSKLTTIGSNSFNNTTFESAIVLPDGLKEINWAAFSGASLLSIDIPESVNIIGGIALSVIKLDDIYVHWCKPLSCIDIFGWESQPEFMATNLSKITLHVPAGLKSEYESASPWNLVWRIVDDQSGILDINKDSEIVLKRINGGFKLLNSEGCKITVHNIAGNVVRLIQNYANEDISLPSGVYIISIDNQTLKVII